MNNLEDQKIVFDTRQKADLLHIKTLFKSIENTDSSSEKFVYLLKILNLSCRSRLFKEAKQALHLLEATDYGLV